MARRTRRREKIYQHRKPGILEKGGSLACMKLKDYPWLWERIFAAAADYLFPSETKRIVVRCSTVRAAYLYFFGQSFIAR
jgi:hypothetical protein